MQKLHQSLDQQLDQLETERYQIAETIIEVKRRIEVLDEVMSWSVPREKAEEELPLEDNSKMWIRRLSIWGDGSGP